MRRMLGTMSTALVILLAAGGGIALAAELDVVPDPVSEGEQALTIDVWDFDPDTPVYVLPCEYPESGDADDVTTDTCTVSEVATAQTDADGAATFEVTWDIPADGIGVYVGNELRSDVVTGLVEVNADDETAAADDDDDADDDEAVDVEVLGTSTTADALAATGADTVPLISLGVGLLALGAATVGTSRRLGPLQS